VRLHGQGVRDLARAEDLHARLVATLDEPGLGQRRGIDHRVRDEAAESPEIHDGVRVLAAVGKEPALGESPVERHLAALEAAGFAPAGARVVALVAFASGLAVARARATPDDLPAMLGARVPSPPRRRTACRSCKRLIWRSASRVAFRTLCGLFEPRVFVRMSWTPAASRIGRTAPPAMTPVPWTAGFRKTRPAPKCPVISHG